MRFQKMHAKHLKAVVELENNNYTQPWTYNQFRNCIPNERSRMQVVLDNENNIIGYMILFRANDGWYLENMTVALEHRRKGVASRFMDEARKIVHPEKIHVLVQDVFLGMHLMLKKNDYKATHVEKDDDGDDYYAFISGE